MTGLRQNGVSARLRCMGKSASDDRSHVIAARICAEAGVVPQGSIVDEVLRVAAPRIYGHEFAALEGAIRSRIAAHKAQTDS